MEREERLGREKRKGLVQLWWRKRRGWEEGREGDRSMSERRGWEEGGEGDRFSKREKKLGRGRRRGLAQICWTKRRVLGKKTLEGRK